MSAKTGVIRVPIEVVYPDLPEPPPAPSEMDTVQGRDAWEAGWYAAIEAVEERAIPAQSARPLLYDDPASVERLAEAIWYGSWEAAPNSWEGVQSTQDADECHREARAIIAALVAEAAK